MSQVDIAIMAIAIAVSAWFLYWCLKSCKAANNAHEQEDFNAPYKVEPDETLSKYDFSPHVMAVSEEYNKDQPTPRAKRAYNKTSKYWTKKRKAKITKGSKKKTRRVIL